MTPEEHQLIHAATKDAVWGLVKKQFKEEMEHIRNVDTIDTDRSAEQIATEIHARKIAYETLAQLLSLMGMFESDPTDKKAPVSRFR